MKKIQTPISNSIGNQGQSLQQLLQQKVSQGNVSNYNVQVPKGNSILSLIIGILPFAPGSAA